MGQRSGCCQEENLEEVPKVEIVHHRQEEAPPDSQLAAPTSWKTCLPLETIRENSQSPQSPTYQDAPYSPSTAARVTLAQTRLQRMDHLVVDRDILRGISLRETLNSGGRLWRMSPIDLDEKEKKALWTRSKPVDSFDWFLSHTWLTPGRWKVLSLVLQSCWHFWLASWILLVTLSAVLCALEVLPMKGTWQPDIMGFTTPCPFGHWVIGSSCAAPILGVAIYMSGFSFSKSPTCFLDVVSIHQTDTDLMERGIYGLGGFLKVSKQLRILWSPPYLTRLWCVFEVAAFRTANPDGEIQLRPLTIEIGITALYIACAFGTLFYQTFLYWIFIDGAIWQGLLFVAAFIPSFGAIRILRRQAFMKRILLSQLRNFDVDQAQCRSDFDRLFIEAAILHWYGSKETFAEYVRGPLASELLRRISNNNATVFGYVLIILSTPVAGGLEWCLSLWMGGARWDVVLSRFVGMVLAVDFFWCAFVLMVAMLLCEILANPCCGIVLPGPVQTSLVCLLFSGFFAMGNAIATAASSLSLWASVLFLVASFCLVSMMRWVTKWRLLENTRTSSVSRVSGEYIS